MMQELFTFDVSVPFHIFEYSPPSTYMKQHYHSFYEIGYCREGQGVFHIGERQIPVGKGDLLLFPPYEPHIAQGEGQGDFRFFFVYFSEELLPEEDRHLLLSFRHMAVRSGNVLHERSPDFSTLEEDFHSMLNEYEAKHSGFASMLRSNMLNLCVRLHRLEESVHAKDNFRGMLRSLSQLKPGIDFVESHYAEPIKLGDLAAILSLSESRARHLFKEGTGKGFKEYLSFVRIQQAKRLLSLTSLPVTEIYLTCGYQSSAPFYLAFQQLVGTSPLEYRRLRVEGAY